MASDLLLGWIIGLITVAVPQLMFEIYKLRRHIRFLTGGGQEPLKKKGLFGWLKGKK